MERDLPPLRPALIPGHPIVGEVLEGATTEMPVGSRVGVSGMGGVDHAIPFLDPLSTQPDPAKS